MRREDFTAVRSASIKCSEYEPPAGEGEVGGPGRIALPEKRRSETPNPVKFKNF